MGHEDAPTPDFTEGQVAGTEVNRLNGRTYSFQGHYMGDGTIVYRASIEDAEGEKRGELSGSFEQAGTGLAPAAKVESILRAAVREAVGYRL